MQKLWEHRGNPKGSFFAKWPDIKKRSYYVVSNVTDWPNTNSHHGTSMNSSDEPNTDRNTVWVFAICVMAIILVVYLSTEDKE